MKLRQAYKKALYSIDALLRRRLGIIEFTDDPAGIFRISLGAYEGSPFKFSDGKQLRAGDVIADLHLWTQQVPQMRASGSDVAWARKMHHSIKRSLSQLARYVALPENAGIKAVRAVTAQATKDQSNQIRRIMERYGFEAGQDVPPHGIGARLHRLGENMLVSLLVLARNPAALHGGTLRRTRVPVFMSRDTLIRTYLG